MRAPPQATLSPAALALDPADAVIRFGLIALSTDLTTERDAQSLLPPELTALHVTRVAFENPTTPENLRLMAPRLTAAADLLLPGTPLAAIYYACTAASVVIGDDPVREAVRAARPGVPVITPTAAALTAFRALGLRRVAVVTPYLSETTQPMVRYFVSNGLDVVSARCMGVEDDRDMARISARTIVDAVREADTPDVEAVFVSCTALPSLGVVGALEAQLGKPVVTSNQAAFWLMLGAAGLRPRRRGFGRVFDYAAPEAA